MEMIINFIGYWDFIAVDKNAVKTNWKLLIKTMKYLKLLFFILKILLYLLFSK